MIFDPIEYRDFKEGIDSYIDQIIYELTRGEYKVKLCRRYLAEKSRGLCRQMTLIHPLDLLVLERLSRSLHYELKSKCPSKSAFFEPDDGSFVKGFHQPDFQYGSYASWRRFQKAVFGFSDENNYIIVTDVANFYDFINFQHLRNIISGLADVRESILDLLIHILNRMTWTPDFMPLSQIGMPQIETSATRVLANAMLFEVDKVCEHFSALNYARFMDDMDIGVDDIPKAKQIIRDIDLTLQSRQLRLNSSKTRILSASEAVEHFCIKENHALARLERFSQKVRWKTTCLKILLNKYERWLQRVGSGEPGPRSAFRRANGSKIHKYIFKLIYELGGRVPEEDLLWLVRNDPTLRSTALRYLSLSRRGNSNIERILEMMARGLFVDDAAMVDICHYLLHARFRRTHATIRRVRDIAGLMERHSDIGLHCALFVSSRFLFMAEILSLVRRNRRRIRSDFWLSRAVAGLTPVFLKSPHSLNHFIRMIRDLKSEDAENVMEYMLALTRTSAPSASLRAYLEAKNDTFAQGVYFPKVLQLLAASRNRDASKLFPKIHAIHTCLRSDQFYKSMGF